MRIRSIRPEFWTSDDVAALDWHQRLVFIGLWSYVDDNGVGRDSEQLITAALFPLDDDLTESSLRVHGALKRLCQGGQISRYTAQGKRWLHITAWDTHQRINRATESRYPTPDQAEHPSDPPAHDVLTEPSLSPQAIPPLGEGEKGRRGEGEKTRARADDTAFDAFWDAYPRTDDKARARKAWATAARKADPRLITAGAARYRDDPNRDPAYTKLAATWLNAESWDNGPLPPRTSTRPTTDTRVTDGMALAARLRDATPLELEPTRGPR